MATVRKARGYLLYLIALLASGLLGVLGRHSPVWAEEVKRDYNAKVFNESFRVAANTSQSTTVTNSNTVTKVRDPRLTFPPEARETFPPSSKGASPVDTRETFPPEARYTFPPEGRYTFPPEGRYTFPPEARYTFPPEGKYTFPTEINNLHTSGIEQSIDYRGTFPPEFSYTQNVQSTNQELNEAIDAVNLKIKNNVELTPVERAFVYSIQMNRDLIDEVKLQQVRIEQSK
ncbi:MAG: hypothetical protein K8R69_01920 [Deltaproteobacteria bacterium]|nr:hypothetical protein [Deltaproteobacteria bacterium]